MDNSDLYEDLDHNVIRTDAPHLAPNIAKRLQIENALGDDPAQIPWPEISAEPINEFTSASYIAIAFPTLFPTGAADLRSPRRVKVSPSEYFQHLMKYKDGRFSKILRFRFFAMNSMSRWSTLQNGKICIQRNSDLSDLTADELRERFRADPGLARRLMCYNSSVRGTNSYWRPRCGELLDMVQQLGAPTLFFTLSVADLHWPELYKLLDPETDFMSLDRNTASRKKSYTSQRESYDFSRQGLLVSNCPHIHGVLWLENAPDVSNLDNADEESLRDMEQYFGNIITTMNPCINAQVPLVHPCKLHYSDIEDHDADYANLINCCQHHTRHGPQCIRKNKTTKQEECRFKFPFPL
ncbi:hypothetical protein M8J75_004058 [Diaphorina citri]|nr:hypothetical protein M8J75_004058 [Diaphorina citri]